jgi:hypothetical protein
LLSVHLFKKVRSYFFQWKCYILIFKLLVLWWSRLSRWVHLPQFKIVHRRKDRNSKLDVPSIVFQIFAIPS